MKDTRAPIVGSIGIIGVGLIGGSLALDLLSQHACTTLTLCDNSRRARTTLGALFPRCRIASLEETARSCDLLVLATPLSAYPSLLATIAPLLPSRTVVSDVGSVKESVCHQFSQLLAPSAVSVPAHPVAGTEHSGAANARANLFRNRYTVITPNERSTTRGVRIVKNLWQRVGARVLTMSAEQHDAMLALTSHLPHAIAYALVLAALDSPPRQSLLAKLSAGGFRDFTRIAASSPQMWHDVFFANPVALQRALQQFRTALDAIEQAVAQGKGAELKAFLTRARASRKKVLSEGQAGVFQPEEPDASASPSTSQEGG